MFKKKYGEKFIEIYKPKKFGFGKSLYIVPEGVPNYVNAHVQNQMKIEFGLDVKKGLYDSLMDDEKYKENMSKNEDRLIKAENAIEELKGLVATGRGGRRTRGKLRSKSRAKFRHKSRKKRRKSRRKSKGRKRRRKNLKKRTKRRR